MISSEQAFLRAITNFPKWMDIRKRPRTSVGGKYLQSIIEEQDNINDTLMAYMKDFFLISYVGREDTLIDYAYIAQVGNVDTTVTIELNLTVTDNAKEFLNNRKTMCLLQDGYIIIDASVKPEDVDMLFYTFHDYKYASRLYKKHIWNVIDEFAMMSSLERFPDETNAQLLQRCFAAFRNPTNSTEQGIKNSITNALINYVPISSDNIIIEKPSYDNIYLEDKEYGSLYERLAQFNKDFFRTKQWDISLWEHKFKELSYIPNKWDEQLDTYQLGVGQNDDLLSIISNNEDATTNIQITGYEASSVTINEYIHKHNIIKEIPLKIEKYNNELIAKNIEYRIKASPIEQIDPTKIHFKSMVKSQGEQKVYLEDIIVNPEAVTQIQHGQLDSNSTYKLYFYPKNEYASMEIQKTDLIVNNKSTSLLKENSIFKFDNGVLKNIDVAAHIDSLVGIKTYDNIIATTEGLTIGSQKTTGEFTIDVTGMGNKPLKIEEFCQEVNYTTDSEFVTYEGFTLTDNNILTASGTDSTSYISIDLDCSSLSFEFVKAVNPNEQGSCSVLITVDDKIDEQSGLWSTGKIYSKNFGKLCHVHVDIQKAGMYPISIKNICASRYRITRWLDEGELIVTPFTTMLPPYNDDTPNNLHIKIEAFSSYAPVIKYVHIGSSLKYASYTIDNITTAKANSSLDISSNCIVKLYKVIDSKEQLVSDNYNTQIEYRNDTNSDISIIIDTSSFSSIVSSSKPIGSTTYAGNVVQYITLKPDESLTSITINGSCDLVKERKSIFELLQLNRDDIVYVTNNANGFIVKSTNKRETLAVISKDMLSYQADSYSYENLPNNLIGYFVLDSINNITSHNNSSDRTFEKTFVVLNDNTEYIAYNSETIFKPEIDDVTIVNTFSPILDISTLMYYQIDKAVARSINATIEFIKIYDDVTEYTDWSLGQKPMRVLCDFDFNNVHEYDLEVNQIKESFVISNIISLNEKYLINGTQEELARYIVTPPNNMIINYESEEVSETIVVEEDGFNKLYYSNVTDILLIRNSGITVPSNAYSLIEEAGILVWNSPDYVGQTIEVMYEYNKPVSLSYKSLDSLYEIIGYSVDAYKIINKEPIVLNNVRDNETHTIDFDGKIPDRIIVRCDNANFGAVIDGNNVTAKLLNTENIVLTKVGYYYDNIGDEYYFFEHIYSDPINKFDSVEFHYIKRTADFLQFLQATTNHILDTVMTNAARYEDLCYINFASQKGIDGISRFNSLTACETFEKWISFKMNVSLIESLNGLGIKFEAQEINSYAILDISKLIRENILISLNASETLNIYLMKEIKAGDDSMAKSIFAEPYEAFTVTSDTKYRQFIFDNSIDYTCRYYILITGSGILDDIIIKDYNPDETNNDIHTKTLSVFDFGVEEKAVENYEHHFLFDVNGGKLNNLEFDYKGSLLTGSNVDWGVTMLYSLSQEDMYECVTENVTLTNGAFYSSNDETGYITLPRIYLNNKNAIRELYVTINDVVMSDMKGFNIKIYTADDLNSPLYVISDDNEKTNIVELPVNILNSYIQIEIEMPPNKVINNVEVYARYSESEYATPRINRNNSGSFISKIYDTTYEANFVPLKLIGSIQNIKYVNLFMRGYKSNKDSEVWTDWYECQIDANTLEIINNPHIFPDYRYFQFRIEINNKDSIVNLKEIVLKVVN